MTTRWTTSGTRPGYPGDIKSPVGHQPPIDPYARWAVASKWRGMRGQGGWEEDDVGGYVVQIMARAPDEASLRSALGNGLLTVADTYRRPVPGTAGHALHFTAMIKVRDLERLVRGEEHLPVSWELSQPRRSAEKVARGSLQSKFGPDRDPKRFLAPNVLGEAIADGRSDAASAPRSLGLEEVIAVIDFGCPFLNTRFVHAEDPSVSRIKLLWDQGSEVAKAEDLTCPVAQWPWTAPRGMGYGRELRPDVIDTMVAAVRPRIAGASDIDEAAAYRGIDYLMDYDDPRRRTWFTTHGTHVLDVAGGLTDCLSGRADAASCASLAFVQLPSLTAADSSGASLASHVLDGVRYVLAECAADAQIVIVISYGSHAGPHDGRSLIESALDELLQLRPSNFAIVLAAGNAREKRCHVRRTIRRDRSALLRIDLSPGDTTDTFVEVWYPRLEASSGDSVSVRVRGPDRQWSPWLDAGEQSILEDTAVLREAAGMVRHDHDVPNGEGKAMVLLCLAPTRQPAGVPGPAAEAGRWEIELRLVGAMSGGARQPPVTEQVVLDARIERDDPSQVPGAGEHRFFDVGRGDDEDTLSSLATGRRTLVAGGFRVSDGRQTDYTSVGPQRDASSPLPMVLAACEEDDVNPNVRATAVRSGESFRMNGTSTAAPVLARRLYNHMFEAPKPVDIAGWRALLQRLPVDEPERFKAVQR